MYSDDDGIVAFVSAPATAATTAEGVSGADDGIGAVAAQPARRARKRRPAAEAAATACCLVYVVIAAEADRASRRMQRCVEVRRLIQARGGSSAGEPGQPGQCLGVLVVEASCCEGPTGQTSVESRAFMRMFSACREKPPRGFVEYHVREAAAFVRPIDVGDALMSSVSRPEQPGDMVEFRQLRRLWCEQYPTLAERRVPFSYFVSPGLGQLLVRGLWDTLVAKITTGGRALRCQGFIHRDAPPASVIQTFLASTAGDHHADALIPADRAAAGGQLVRSFWGVVTHRVSMDTLLKAVIACRDLKDIRRLPRTSENIFKLHLGDEGAAKLLDELRAQGFMLPSRTLILEGMVRLDIAAMCMERVLNNVVRDSGVRRFISVDASPQFGVECFCGVESFMVDDRQCLTQQLLPLVTLGVGKLSLLDKIMAFLWTVFLIAGPTAEGVRKYCSEVYSVTTDFGVESLMCDFADVVAQFMQGHTHIGAGLGLAKEALFPSALRIPGMNHIIDNVLSDCLSACKFFPSWLRQLKKVMQFLHVSSNRDVLKERAKQVMPHSVALMEHWSENFAKWRWGTLVLCLAALLKTEEVLRASYMPEDFPNPKTEREDRKEAGDAIRCPRFWRFCQFIYKVTKPTESLRSWCTGCSCHEEQLREGKSVSCWYKSRRILDLSPRLEDAYEFWRGCLAGFEYDGDMEVIVAADWLCRSFIGQLKLKCAFLFQLPYSVVLVFRGDREVAQQCLEAYERDCAAFPKDSIHRVSHKFLAEDSVYRPMVHSVATGGPVPPQLSEALLPYTCIPLSEAEVEGVHARVKKLGRCPGATAAWRFATVRLDQNIALYESCKSQAQWSQHFSSAWSGWKSVTKKALRRNSQCSMALRRPLKIKRKEFYKQVYRLGQHALQDWAPLQGQVPALLPPDAKVAIPYTEQLVREYLSCVLQRGGLYTLPVYGHIPENPLAIVPADAQEESSSFMVFQVLDMSPFTKKLIRTTTSIIAQADVQSAMQLQLFRQWPAEQRSPGRSVVAFAEEIVLRDIIKLAPWHALRSSLQVWKPMMADTEGCLELVEGQVAAPVADLHDPKCPTLALLEHLHAEGWQPGRTRGAHLPGDAVGLQKLYSAVTSASGKHYLRCLVQLQMLFNRGGQTNKKRLPDLLSPFAAPSAICLRVASDRHNFFWQLAIIVYGLLVLSMHRTSRACFLTNIVRKVCLAWHCANLLATTRLR